MDDTKVGTNSGGVWCWLESACVLTLDSNLPYRKLGSSRTVVLSLFSNLPYKSHNFLVSVQRSIRVARSIDRIQNCISLDNIVNVYQYTRKIFAIVNP